MEVNDANLDNLKGMPDVAYDFSVANSLAAMFRLAARNLRDQHPERASYRLNARKDFKGHFSVVFRTNGTTQLSDLDEIVRNLDLVATKVEAVTAKARAENARRRAAREWAERRAKRGFWERTLDRVGGGEEPPYKEIADDDEGPSESVTAGAPQARQTPQPGSVGNSNGTSSARPGNLKDFATKSRAADEALRAVPGQLEGYCLDFATSCSWATLDASSVLSGYRQWLLANEEDAKWAQTVGQAFEDAGGSGEVSALPDSAVEAVLAGAGVSSQRADIVIDPPTAYGSPPTTGYSDDPVNTSTGAFLEVEEDLGFAGASGSLAWTRSYSSLNPVVGAFGRGWSSWAEVGLVLTGDAARLTLPDGRVVVFPRAGRGWGRAEGESLWLERAPVGQDGASQDGAGQADGPGGAHPDSASQDGTRPDGDEDVAQSGGYVVSSSWGLRWLIDSVGRVVHAGAGPGTGVTLSWEGERLVRLTHERGRFVDLSWEGGRVVGAVSSDGRRVVYDYDEVGRLVGVVRPVGSRTYRWDEASLLAQVVDADGVVEVTNTFDQTGRVTTQRSPFGRTTRYSYLAGGVTATSDEDGSRGNTWIHDRRGRLVGVVDAQGRRQSMGYDRWGNKVMVRTRDGQATACVFDDRGRIVLRRLPSGARQAWEWDELDRLVSATVTGADDGAGGAGVEAVTRFVYEGPARQPCRVVDPEGGVTRLLWGPGGLLARVVDPTGVGVDFAYDDFGELVAVTNAEGAVARLERDAAGRVVAAVTPLGNRTEYRYDPDTGLLATRTDPTGGRWSFEYTAAGRMSARVDPMGGRTTVSWGQDGQVETTTDPLGRVVGQWYDDLGNLAGMRLPDGSTWELGYDALSHLTHVKDAAGGQWSISYGADGLVSATQDPTGVRRNVERGPLGEVVAVHDGGEDLEARCDRLGRVVSVTGPDGTEQTVRYDRCGRVVEAVDATGAVTRYERDAAGRAVAVTQPTGGVYRYEYDRCGRWSATVSTGGDRYEILYDADSRLVGEIWPDGGRVSTRFDAAGRIVERRTPGRGVVRFSYDKCGRITTIQDPWHGTRRLRYDAAGQLVAAVDGAGGVTRYEYDALSHQVAVTDPAGNRTTRSWDAMGRLVADTDPLGRTTSWSWDASGRPVRRAEATGRVLEWAYNTAGRLEEVRADGDLLARLRRDPAARTMSADGPGGSVSWTWDACGRLVSRLRDGVGVSYTYDVAGRRTGMRRPDGVVTRYSYDANNRLAVLEQEGLGRVDVERDPVGRVVGVRGPGLEARWRWEDGFVVGHRVDRHGLVQETGVERDAGGRVVAEVRDGARTDYDYDAAGRLVGAVTSEGTVCSWSWDVAGRLVRRVEDGASTVYDYDAAGQLVTARVGGAVTTYSYDAAGRRTRQAGPGGERRLSWGPRGELASVTDVVRRGDRLWARRQELVTDPGGETARVGGVDVFWDSAAVLPALAQVGTRVVTDALTATALTGGEEGTAWLVPDTDGPTALAGQWAAAGTGGTTGPAGPAVPTGAGGPAAPTGAGGAGGPAAGAGGAGGPGPAGAGAGGVWGLGGVVGVAGPAPWVPAGVGAGGPGPAGPGGAGPGGAGAPGPAGPAGPGGAGPGGVGVSASGGLVVAGLGLLGARAYDPVVAGFLSPDPLGAPAGVGWAGARYSYAGGDPVGAGDPTGLSPVSEADLRAYQQASHGALGAALGAAGSWLAGNWEYLAAGALVVAGVAVMCTGVGGPVGAAVISGALTSAGMSAGTQKMTTGRVDWGQVAVDGAIGAASSLAGGGAVAAVDRATRGMRSCLGRNLLSGAAEGAAENGVSSGLEYLTSGEPVTVGGLARAVGGGALDGALDGASSAALEKATGTARYGCFTPTTPVLMADGTTRPIKDVRPGDRVASRDPATGRLVAATVDRTHTHARVPTIRLTTTSGTVTTTATHPVHVVSVQATGHTTTVHNLTIRHTHNYHVHTTTKQAILVHNTTPAGGCGPDEDELRDAARQLRDEYAASFSSNSRPATVVAAYVPGHGVEDIRVGRSGSREELGPTKNGEPKFGCAEDDAYYRLKEDVDPDLTRKDIRFVEPVRPRTGKGVDPCVRCQTRFDKSQFPPGVKGQKGGAWGDG